MMGREVARVFNGTRTAGIYVIEFKTAQLRNGVYYYRMIADVNGKRFIQTQKLMKVE